jgi:hypothetical protein
MLAINQLLSYIDSTICFSPNKEKWPRIVGPGVVFHLIPFSYKQRPLSSKYI